MAQVITYLKRAVVCLCVCVCVCLFNLRYKTHQAVSFIQWLRLSSDDKAMFFEATTQTEPSSLGMLGELF